MTLILFSDYLVRYLKRQGHTNAIEFYISASQFVTMKATSAALHKEAHLILDRFVSYNSMHRIDIDDTVRREIIDMILCGDNIIHIGYGEQV